MGYERIFVCLTLILFYFSPVFYKNAFADRLDPGLIDSELKGVPFGANLEKLIEFLKERVNEKYRPLIQSTLDTREIDKLRKEMSEEVEKVDDNIIKFISDNASMWKISVIGNEFEVNTGEFILIRTEGMTKFFFFFIEDKLWKIIKTIPSGNLGFSDFIMEVAKYYNPPDEIKYSDSETKTIPSKAIWESKSYRFILENKEEIFKCVKETWTDRVFEDSISQIREKGKVSEEKKGIDPLINEVTTPSKSDTIDNEVDKILGIKKEKEKSKQKEEGRKKGVKKYRKK